MSKQRRAHISHITSLILFGSNGVVASLIALPSHEIVFFRTLLGSLLLVLLFKLSGSRFGQTARRDAIFLALSGISMGISWMFLYEAYRHIGVSVASLVYYSGPVIIIALSPFLFGETLTGGKISGFAAVFAGLALLNVNALHEGKTPWGLFCGLMSAVSYAGMVIFNKKASGVTGLKNAMLQLLVSFFTVALFIGVRQRFVIRLAPPDVLPILLLGLVNTGLGCYLYFAPIGRLPALSVAILGYLEPLSAMLFSVLFLAEALRPVHLLAAALIIGGAVFAESVGRVRRAP